MLKTVKETFRSKIIEIESHFRILRFIDTNTNNTLHANGVHGLAISSSIAKIYKSVSIMLLYNLVESTVKSSINELFNEINKRQLDGTGVTQQVFKQWVLNQLRRSRSRTVSDAYNEIIEVANKILAKDDIHFCEDVFHFSGNIDYREVKRQCAKINLKHEGKRIDSASDSVRVIKDIRNGLAHGDYSFGEKGGNYTYSDIEKMKKDTYKYLKMFMKDLEFYVDNKQYESSAY